MRPGPTRWAALLLLAGCARDDTPQGACEHQVYQDPVVKELISSRESATRASSVRARMCSPKPSNAPA